jgi:hypothetical protein
VRRGRCQSRDAAPPAPVRLTRRALEGGPAAPSIYLSCDPAGLGGGARTGGTPSLPLSTAWLLPPRVRAHVGHCGNNSSTVERAGTGRHLTCHCASYGPMSATPSSLSEGITAVRCPSPSKPLLFGYKIRHDDRIAARIARADAYSTNIAHHAPSYS